MCGGAGKVAATEPSGQDLLVATHIACDLPNRELSIYKYNNFQRVSCKNIVFCSP